MKQLIENGRLALRLLQDPRVPTWIKVGVPLLVAIYFLSPIDLIPDFLIGPGQIDDLGVVLLGMTLLIRLAPQNVVEEHRSALGASWFGGGTGGGAGDSRGPGTQQAKSKNGSIEGEYRVIPPDQEEPVDNRTRKL
jgi:uncharacterized membrane protein YkvA (DUF1232 family)